MAFFQVILPMSLTMEQQIAILRYLSGGYLSKNEWRDALAGFDRLRQAKIIEGLRERSLAFFYREVVDNVYASSLIAELLESADPEQEGKRLALICGERIRRDLIERGLNVRVTEHRLVLAYVLYWWMSFAKGYSLEIAVFLDLRRAGISFESHDLLNPQERFSSYDLTICNRLGDIKASTYFLETARSFPLRMAFYIVRLYRTRVQAWRWAVLLSPDFWREINGEPVHAPLEDALLHFPQPVYFEVKKTPLIAVDYAVWKEKVRAFQARGGNKNEG
ncbi:hypothetical protein FJZ31_42205 [Candidatus Poribacteria bacterium]|nr:hypothetical protein [Candidatus Poribacteria bacterium]